ncbi:MAG TPA: ABC transporter permease subunit, partial [Actinobacteria bacterium]|nr:ABC transporter permease subunit [Actinomycetota bacterium]
ELLDEVPRDTERAMRAAGASRFSALLFGTVPTAFADLISYSFYRFECAIRSAAVLGIVGAGGLGFQLALSFQSLRYNEMWTLLWALILLSGLADRWSSLVRRRRNTAAIETHAVTTDLAAPPRRDRLLTSSALAGAVMVPVSFWWLKVDISSLWDSRARRLGRELVTDSWPPSIGDGGLIELVSDSLDTIALAVLSIAMAFVIASAVAGFASRPQRKHSGLGMAARIGGGTVTRAILLIGRSVPPPVWAFVVVFVLFPGLWPGAVALAIYNAGVLGRLQAEIVENLDQSPADALRASGATAVGALAYATVPAVSGRFVSLGLYRWEVAIRETVIVGVVGAAGLGRRLDEQTSSFDYDGIFATILALLVVTLIVDLVSSSIRRTLR